MPCPDPLGGVPTLFAAGVQAACSFVPFVVITPIKHAPFTW